MGAFLPSIMTAVRVHETGGVDSMKLESVPVPTPEYGQVLVKVAASGVNFIDTYQRSGLYPVSESPFILGKEGAGQIVTVGDGVTERKVGDRVVFTVAQGCYADYVVVSAKDAYRIPAKIDLQTAAASMIQGLTAHYLTTSTHPISAGETVLIHAGAGGTGGLLVQMAKLRGAVVITTVSTAAKAKLAKHNGADHVIVYSQFNFQDEVMKLTNNMGVQVVFDGVGQSTWKQSLNCLSPLGHLILFGNASGPVPPIDPLLLTRAGSITLSRPSLQHYIADPQIAADRVDQLFGWIQSGKIRVRVGSKLPLSSVRQAHESLQARSTTGKILILPHSD